MKKWLVPALLLIGSSLVVISIWSPKSQKGRGASEDQIAFVVEKTGDAHVANNEMPEAVVLKVNSSLNAKDIVTTGDNSDVAIQWKNEGQFRVLEKSEVLLDQLDNGQFLIVVRSGDLYIEKFGSTPFWIRKDGQMLNASDFALSDKSKLSKLKDPVPAKSSTDVQLSQADIEALLNSKKTDFFKCYGQVLQRNAQAQGSVLIAFTILNQGQTTKVEVSKSDINDTHFKACLTEVVSRTQFKAFSGPPITTVFPLKFE
jgi:hypothetical protein